MFPRPPPHCPLPLYGLPLPVHTARSPPTTVLPYSLPYAPAPTILPHIPLTHHYYGEHSVHWDGRYHSFCIAGPPLSFPFRFRWLLFLPGLPTYRRDYLFYSPSSLLHYRAYPHIPTAYGPLFILFPVPLTLSHTYTTSLPARACLPAVLWPVPCPYTYRPIPRVSRWCCPNPMPPPPLQLTCRETAHSPTFTFSPWY